MDTRTASMADLQSLSDMEQTAFTYDVISKKCMRHLIKSKTAQVNIAYQDDTDLGYSIFLMRKKTAGSGDSIRWR